jgi:hypothetical protein
LLQLLQSFQLLLLQVLEQEVLLDLVVEGEEEEVVGVEEVVEEGVLRLVCWQREVLVCLPQEVVLVYLPQEVVQVC